MRPARSARPLTAFVVCAWVWLSSPPARAQIPPSTVLSWTAPPDCPKEREFIAEVERFLGQALEHRRDQKLDIRGRVHGTAASGFIVELRLTSVRGTRKRTLSHENCSQLTEAAALVAALAIDPKLTVPPVSAQTPAESESGPRVQLDLWAVGVKACGLPVSTSFVLAACFGPEIGDLRGSGRALDNQQTRHARWSALGVELTLAHEAASGLTTLLGVAISPVPSASA